MATKRRNYIDIVKGVSILTLFFLHFENGVINLDYNIFLVRSPSFYVVIGWLWALSSNHRTIKEHYQKRKATLVMPYIWFSLIFIAIDAVYVACNLIEPFVLYRDIYKTICLRGIGTLWFLPSLLLGEITFIYFRDKSLNIKVLLLLLASTIVVGDSFFSRSTYLASSQLKDIISAPLSFLQKSSLAFIFITIAYYITKKIGRLILDIRRYKLLILSIIGFVITFCLWLIPTNGIILLLSLRYIITGIFAGYSMIMLAIVIENMRIFQPLVYFGKNSLITMAVHYSILLEASRIINKYIFHNESFSGVYTLYYFAIALILQCCFIELINRKAKFLTGKK